jgi:chemotaxis protein histidine kinase CheA
MKIKVSCIDANPHRDLKRNPLSEEQISKLVESISRTGFWDNLVVRQHPDTQDRYQLAYGHNRLAACQQIGINEVDLPVRDLTEYDMYCCMVDENNTQQSITPKIIFENVTAALALAERLLSSTENVEQFNELLKSGKYSTRNTSFFWSIEKYNQAKSSIAETGDGLGIGFIKHFMPSPPRDETLQTVIDSYYADRRKKAAEQRRLAAEQARLEAEEQAKIAEEHVRQAQAAEDQAYREQEEAREAARQAQMAVDEGIKKRDEAARLKAAAEQEHQRTAQRTAAHREKEAATQRAKHEKEAARRTKEAEKKKTEAQREKEKSERMDYAGVDRELLEKLPNQNVMTSIVNLIKTKKIPKEFHSELVNIALEQDWTGDRFSNPPPTCVAIQGASWWDIRSGERARRLEESSVQARLERMRKQFGSTPFPTTVFSVVEKLKTSNSAAKLDLTRCSEYFCTLSPDELERLVKVLVTIKEDCNQWMDAIIGKLLDSSRPKEKDITPLAVKSLEFQPEEVQ